MSLQEILVFRQPPPCRNAPPQMQNVFPALIGGEDNEPVACLPALSF